MNKLIVTAILLLFSINIFSQQKPQPKYILEAKKSFESCRYFEAATKTEKAYIKMGAKASIKDRGEMAFTVAECYRLTEKFLKASDWYSKSIELKYFQYNAMVYFYKGEMQRMSKDFEGAIKSYEQYRPLASKSMLNQLDQVILACKEFGDFDQFESRYEIQRQDKINTKQFDMAPHSSTNGKAAVLYFSSSREESTGEERDPITGEKYTDVYMVKYDEKGDPTAVKTIDSKGIVNTTQNEGAVCFDSKKKSIYFTRCPNTRKKNLGCDIWMATISGKPDDLEVEFEDPIKISLKSDDSISVGHPCLINDEYLVFASDMSESNGVKSYGGRDLWYVQYNKKEKRWDSIPKNMGPMINSFGNELFPSFNEKSGVLYFASDGHKGIGGLDIFKVVRSGKDFNWTNRRNLNYPFNSEANDYGITIVEYVNSKNDSVYAYKEKYGFFTSERKSTEFTPDIWKFDINPLLYSLQVKVYEIGDKSKSIEGAKVEIEANDGERWEGLSNSNGKTEKWELKKDKKSRYIIGGKEYFINVSKAWYITPTNKAKITTIDESEGPNFYVEIPLIPIEIRTPEVRYPLDQWTFIDDATCRSYDSLQFLVNLLKQNPTLCIELSSHTDARDTETHNNALSQNRANAVYTYLVDKAGIAPDRIKPIGKGESEPAVIKVNGKQQKLDENYINQFKDSNKKEFERLHQINRRTTVRVITEVGSDIPVEYPKFKFNIDPSFRKFTNPLPR
ncbi:MAG: OmpA family protein [Crocinitomicaceae bacterium]